MKHLFYKKYGKRFLDLLLSTIATVVFSPLLAALSLLVLIKHGRPILFSPTRPGRDEKIFRLYKFRTMSNARDKEGILLPEKERITRFGRFLRSTSLDELPELFNIIKGDMSIVGPRPLPMKYLPYYNSEERKRHVVRPGLTGLAQINGRNNLKWPQRFEMDIKYIEEMSFLKDFSIVLKTIEKVFRGTDIVVPGDTDFHQFDTFRMIERQGVGQDHPEYTRREIGGEFWTDETMLLQNKRETLKWLPKGADRTLTFSGRAAIDLAIEDILSSKKINRVAVPSYCSFSMLQPFIKRNINYVFYNVTFANGKINYQINNKCDVVLVASLFGINRDSVDALIHKTKIQGSIVIEDITHSLLDCVQGNSESDYYIASLRKWFPISTGGLLVKNQGKLFTYPSEDGDLASEKVRLAMQEKANYINRQGIEDKETYIAAFSSFESDLVQLSSSLDMDLSSKEYLARVDIESVKRRRKRNGAILSRLLTGVNGIEVISRDRDYINTTPLYVPVLVHDKRDDLDQYLCKRGIYCLPVWPETMGAKRSFQGDELSLICDQRYTEKDMIAIAEAIKEWAVLNN